MTDIQSDSIAPLSILSPYEKLVIKRYLLGSAETNTVVNIRRRAKTFLPQLKATIKLLELLVNRNI